MRPIKGQKYIFKFLRLEFSMDYGFQAVNRSMELTYVRADKNAYIFTDKRGKETRIDKSVFKTSCTLKEN